MLFDQVCGLVDPADDLAAVVQVERINAFHACVVALSRACALRL
jgi:hypothetical protein